MRPSRSERAIARETALHISSIAKHNKRVNLVRELALLHTTDDRRFHGDTSIESREDAILIAKTMSNSEPLPVGNPRKFVFFVDGSRFTSIKDKAKRKTPGSGKATGAAVVFQTPGWGWEERTFCLADGLNSKSAEAAAIAEALAIVVSQILQLGNDQRRNKTEVTVFTDCPAAILQLEEWRRTSPSQGQLHSDPIVRKLVTRSQYLRRLGVKLEIRWVPGHSGVEGNVRADSAARSAAGRCPGIAEGVYLDEGLRIIEHELAGQEGRTGT